jgi:hypothetical protein
MSSGGLQPLQPLDDDLSGATLLTENTASPTPQTSLASPVGSTSTVQQNDSSTSGGSSSMFDPTGGALSSVASLFSSAANLSVSRLVAVVLGLIFIFVGLIMFRPVGDVFKEGAKAAVKGGVDAAKAGAV